MNCKDCAEYGSDFCKDCGRYLEEDVAAVSTASIPNPATTAMGPSFKPKNVTDRRRKKQMVLLKRFRKYMEDNG